MFRTRKISTFLHLEPRRGMMCDEKYVADAELTSILEVINEVRNYFKSIKSDTV